LLWSSRNPIATPSVSADGDVNSLLAANIFVRLNLAKLLSVSCAAQAHVQVPNVGLLAVQHAILLFLSRGGRVFRAWRA